MNKHSLNTITLMLLSLILLTSQLFSKDYNIRSYVDRGIKFYPKYVPKGHTKVGKASWYGKPFHKRLTASGERYNMYHMTAAHKTYALNTVVKVTNLKNNKSVKVRINDRGPFKYHRDIDLSYAAAKKIGMVKKGVERVKVEVLSSPKKGTIKTLRNQKIQLASFKDNKTAKAFIKKHRLKNSYVSKKYLTAQKKNVYRVVVKCTPWEAKHLIKSAKFKGAFLLS